jgi:hypothetical protein
LGRYRSFKKTKQQQRAERIVELAADIKLSRAALDNHPNAATTLAAFAPAQEPPKTAFIDPDPFNEFTFPDRVTAKQAIAAELSTPLAKLNPEQLDTINRLVTETLNKRLIFEKIHAIFNSPLPGLHHVK